MEQIQLNVVNRAMKMLESAGAQFVIIAGEHRYGTLQLAEPKKAITRARTGIDWKQFGIKEKLITAKPGDVLIFPAGDNVDHEFIARLGRRVSTLR